MFSKPKKIKSRKIRQSAKGQDCTLRIIGVCNSNPETTILAHVNSRSKGIGNKSHDIHAVYCCSSCHDWLDGRTRTAQNTELRMGREILRALLETQNRMIQQGLIEVK